LAALAASAREQGKADELLTIQTDLASDAATDEITRATRDRFGRIDISTPIRLPAAQYRCKGTGCSRSTSMPCR
jgi:hypothetical protein